MVEARTRSRWVKWMGAVLASALLAGFVAPLAAALLLRAVAREKVIELLERRFDRVEVEKLDVQLSAGWSLLPLISAKGTGLSVSLPDREEAPPFITMGEFTVDVELLDLARDPIRVRSLRLDELEIQIPPRRGAEEKRASSEREPPPPFVIEDLVADGALLRIFRRDPEDAPLEFDLHELRVLSAGVSQPMRFESLLDNAIPPGRIKTKGSFGPLVLREPGESPVSGAYVFADADLSVFGGIRGILYAEGQFDGVLERIEVNGFTETPDFQLSSVGNPVHLKTQFHAVVDGTNGNTFLKPVNAVLQSSRFETEGGVSRLPSDKTGKTVCVDARGERGQIQDFLRLAMKSERPFMTGEVRFKSMVLIPPGDVDVVEKLVLDGEFAIESAHFPEPAVQKRVDDLSQAGSGVGDAEEALASLRAERVLSDTEVPSSFRRVS